MTQVSGSSPLQEDAAFIAQNIPTTMKAGRTYRVVVKMENTGAATWTDHENYGLESATATPWGNGLNSIRLINSTVQGSEYAFAFDIAASAKRRTASPTMHRSDT